MNILKKNIVFLILSAFIVLSCKPDIPLLAPGLADNQVFNVDKPTLSWDIPVGAVSFEYSLNGGEWVAVEKGVTEITFDEKLKDGVYTFAIRSRDAEGAASPIRTITIIVDTSSVSKPKPIAIGLNANNITSNVRPQIVWAAIEGAIGYRVSVNGGAWIVYNNANKLSYIPSKDLVAGTYEIKVCALSSSGKWSDPGSVKFVLATESSIPGLSGISPTNNTKPTWDWSVTMDTDNPIVKFRYQLNRELVGGWIEEDVEAGNPTGSFTPEDDLLDGLYVLYVQALDSLGNWSESGSLGITIDTEAPVKPRIRGEVRTNNTSPVWTWTYADADDIAKIQCKVDGNNWENFEGNNTTSYQLKSEDYIEGVEARTYEFFIKVFDAVGNESDEVQFDTIIDTSLPDKPVLSTNIPEFVKDSGEYLTRNQRPNWSWDVPENAVGFKYQICLGEDEVDEANWIEVDANETTYEPDVDLDTGVYTLYVQARNELGSWTESSSLKIEIDITPPVTPKLSGITPTGATQPAWNWAADSDVDKYLVRIVTGEVLNFGTEGAKTVWGNATTWLELKGNVTTFRPSSPLNTTSSIPGYHEYPYKLEIRALDRLGNASSIGFFEIMIDTDTPPSPVYTGPVKTNVANDFELTWSWIISPAQAFSYQLVNANNPVLGEDDAYELLSGSSFTKKVNLTEGINRFYLRGQDGGNLWSAPEETIIILDTIGPNAPVVTGLEATDQSNLSWSWNVPADTYGYRYKIIRQGDATVWYDVKVEITSISYEVPSSSGDGDYTIIVVALDDLGNPSEETSFTTAYDTTPPAAPVVTGDEKSSEARPTWTWTAEAGCTKFKVELNNSGNWIEVNDFAYRPPTVVDSGDNILKVYAYDKAGNESETYGSFIIEVDLDPPLPPVFYVESPTSDRTPTWYWGPNPADPDDVAGYKYRLGTSGDWTEVDASVTKFEIKKADTLDWGNHILYLQARDEAGNYSIPPVQGLISIQQGAMHTGLPKQFSFTSVSEGKMNCAIRLEWEIRNDCYDGLEGYEIERREYGTNVAKILSLSKDYNAEDYFIDRKNEDNTYVVYDWTADLGKEYVYRIRGINDDVEGSLQAPWSNMTSPPEIIETLRGNKLYAPLSGLSIQPSNARSLKLDWQAVRGANYRVLKSGPFTSTKTESQLNGETWYYQEEGSSTWKEYSPTIAIDSTKVVATNTFTDTGLANQPIYYYRVYSVSKEHNPVIDAEGLAQDGYNVSETALTISGILMPEDINSWLSVSDNDASCPGKIKLTINVPAPYNSFLSEYDFEIDRKYRWGGGYQGHNATKVDKTTHVSLTNPNPLSAPMEKTITLEYNAKGSTFSGNSKVLYDTLYDTDASGNKLLAVRTKIGVPMFYERTQAQINADPDYYEVIVDPDNTPAEHEWHYLKWDWVVRKTDATSKAKAANFDINLMTRADYTLRMKRNKGSTASVVSTSAKYGWPALTAREFANMMMFFRDVAFHGIVLSYADEQLELGMSTPKDDITDNGWISGQICAHNNTLSLSPLGVNTNMYTRNGVGTDPNAVYNFPGVGINVQWRPLTMLFGGDPKKSLNNQVVKIVTPKWSGEAKLDGSLYGGTYYHGVHTDFKVYITHTPNYTGGTVESYMPTGKGYLGGHNLPHEYLNNGFSWGRAVGNNPNSYYDRFTSVNWRPFTAGKVYPGF